MKPLDIAWVTDPELVKPATDFFLANLSQEYIAMGEYTSGRALPDGGWKSDLADIITLELSQALRGTSKKLALAKSEGNLVALAVVSFSDQNGFAHAMLDDLITRSDIRGEGLGAQVLGWIESALVKQGVRYLALQNGSQNLAGQRFFERQGYRSITTLRMKELEPE